MAQHLKDGALTVDILDLLDVAFLHQFLISLLLLLLSCLTL